MMHERQKTVAPSNPSGSTHTNLRVSEARRRVIGGEGKAPSTAKVNPGAHRQRRNRLRGHGGYLKIGVCRTTSMSR